MERERIRGRVGGMEGVRTVSRLPVEAADKHLAVEVQRRTPC